VSEERNQADENVLRMFLSKEKRACFNVFVVQCPMARAVVAEANCSACPYRRDLIYCVDTKRFVPEAWCETCFAEGEQPDKHPCMCRYAKMRRGRFGREKLEIKPACAYPRPLEIAQLVLPAGAVAQNISSCMVVPESAPPPPNIFPDLAMDPVTKASQIPTRPARDGDDDPEG
jgi:hypothetical protein